MTTTEGLSLAGTISQLTGSIGAAPAGEAIGLATSLEVATAPVGALSGGFATKLDPTTGLKVRKATTFGPSFAERALTSGEGSVSLGASFRTTTYTKIGDLSLDRMQLLAVNAPSSRATRSGIASLAITSKTLILSGAIGVTDNFDVGVAIPLVSVRVDGTSVLQNGDGEFLVGAKGSGESSGIGDIAALLKYRFLTFGEGQPDPGGIAVAVTMRMATGDRQNLRGLGLTRTLVSLVASSGRGRFRPHANVGYEAWDKGVDVVTDFTRNTTVRARHQLHYAAGVGVEAAPKLTLMVDFLGQHVQRGGRVDFQSGPPPTGATSAGSLLTLSEGVRKLILVPGLKVNLKGKMLLSLNALTALSDDGLHARFTPVVGIDLSL